MPTAQRLSETTAFRTASTPYGLRNQAVPGADRVPATARGGAPSPGPAHAQSRAGITNRTKAEAQLICTMVATMFTAVAIGALIVNGPITEATEGGRHTRLQSQLRQEQAMNRLLIHQQTVATSRETVQQAAAEKGMVHADDAQTLMLP